ncbi:leucine-rich repeat domain-containing protein [uncultured Robinsoniella sp.]|uniref:leucine-rich repeat domain-containing protein n=1 Tax=uncultured Robinsoniella sp. TaxID=904190 RepID=UPI00374E51D5
MKKKLLNSFIIVFLCFLFSINVKAEEIKIGENVYASVTKSTKYLNGIIDIRGTGDTYNFDLDGYDATGLVKNPFSTINSIKPYNVNIDEGVTSIGDYLLSFGNFEIEKIVFPNSLIRIGRNAFFSKEIKNNVVLPQSLKIIEEGAFAFSLSLDSNKKPEKLTLPSNIVELGTGAFTGCTLISEVSIPENIKVIKNNTFGDCINLTKVNLPQSLIQIEGSGFVNCSNLSKITLPPRLKSIGQDAFKGCILLTNIDVPGSMQTIGANAFAGCRRLFNVTMQEGVRTIDDNAFNGCIRLQTMTLPASIQSIGDFAFNQCTMLRSVMVRNGNTNLGRQVFNGCPVTLSASKGSRVQAYAKSNGIGFKDNGSYAVPFVTQEYISGSFRYKVLTSGSNGGTVQVIAPINNKKTKLTIPDTVKLNTYNFTVTSIAKNAFKSNKKLQSVNIGKYVTSIGDRAFYNCSALTSVKFGNKVNEIGKAAFRGCSNLKKVKLPTKVTSIKDELFYGCKKLTSVTLSNNTTSVGNGAFSGCSSLKSITLPSRVKTLGSKAFYNCKNLKKITVKGTALRKVGSSALKKINSQAVIKVPKSKVRKYTSLFKGKGQSKTVKVSK